jgi:hypothetical protein
MTAKDAIELYKLFDQHGIKVWIDGAWGVDALIGRQTRKHDDLDVALNHSNLLALRKHLEDRGYRHVPSAVAGVVILSSVMIKAIELTSIRLSLMPVAKILLALPTAPNT